MKKSQIIQILSQFWKRTYRRYTFSAIWTEEVTPHDNGTHGMGILFVAKFGRVYTDTKTFSTGALWWKKTWRRRFELLGLRFDERIVA
jgi:hypothetical protein